MASNPLVKEVLGLSWLHTYRLDNGTLMFMLFGRGFIAYDTRKTRGLFRTSTYRRLGPYAFGYLCLKNGFWWEFFSRLFGLGHGHQRCNRCHRIMEDTQNDVSLGE